MNIPSPSPSKRLTSLGGSLSPMRNMRGSKNLQTKPQNNYQEILKKEQEKIAKRLLMKQNPNDKPEEDQDNDFEEKHPYIQVAIDKEVYGKKYMIKANQFSNSAQKEFIHKEKNLITDLPDPQNYIIYNGIECQLKKAFGQYQRPINKSIHFISQRIEANLNEITAFEVQTFDTQKQSLSPVRQQITNSQETMNTNSSPQQQQQIRRSQEFQQQPPDLQNAFESKEFKSQMFTPQLLNTASNIPQGTGYKANQGKELLTLIAFAEKAKETYIKETKFNTKKIYGIQNSKNKKLQQQQQPSSDLRSPSSPLKSPLRKSMNEELQDEFSTLNITRFLVKVNVFNLANPQKKFVLQHFFDEYFYVQQISIRDKESLCYTLCSNHAKEQIFFIWNFRKEIVIGYVEMSQKINKFVVTPNKSDNILFLGESYLKYYEANFTNKIIKENQTNIIPMKIEKESNFIDMEYIPAKGNNDMFVLIADNNSIFVYEKNVLKHKLFDQFRETSTVATSEDKFDSILSDSLDIGELSDRENIGKQEEHLKIKSKGTNAKDKAREQNPHNNNFESASMIGSFQKKYHGSQVQFQDEKPFKNEPETSNQNELIKFQKLIVTQKGFIVGSENGYIVCYEFKNDFEPKLINTVHISNKVKAIASMSISKGNLANDDYYIAMAGVYQKKGKKITKQQANIQDQESQLHLKLSRRASIGGSQRVSDMQMSSNFFMPNLIPYQKTSIKGVQGSKSGSIDPNRRTLNQPRATQSSFAFSQTKFNQIFDDNYEYEEKQELFVISMKAILTQQHNKIAEKIFSKGCHDSSIFAVAQCRNKSTFYTISESQNLKMWNHTNEWKGISNYTFDEQPLCIDIHPSSWQVAVGFKSGLKIYQSLEKELKLSFEKLGKAAFSLAYADGGHLLACTNAVYIDIIDPIRMQLLMTLFGHKGIVKQLYWTQNSKYLISTCSNGGLYFWRGNFKEQVTKNIDGDTTPITQLNDKSYLYLQIAYDDDIDTVIALTSTSTLRLFLNYGQDPIHEEDLLQTGNFNDGIQSNSNFKATCMAFSKQLNILAIGYSNGKVGIYQWPIIPNIQTFKYFIYLQTQALTDIKFSHLSRYILVTTDDGNFYVLETFKVVEGMEKTWVIENQERLQLQKKRETNNLTGFSVLDNVVMSNKDILNNVNRKIDKLKTVKKSQEINHEIKKRKSEKRYDKQMKLIEKELQEELTKQSRLIEGAKVEFEKEKIKLEDILNEQRQEHNEETNVLVSNKEKNLNFVANENDELETRILRLKETIIEELEKIEVEHQDAVNDLVKTYEQSVKLAQEEVKNTIDKLKQNGGYYENMIQLQEKDYENEVNKLQSDLIEEHTEFMNKKNDLQKEHNELKDKYQEMEESYKKKNREKKEKASQVRELQGEFKYKFNNVERLIEKEIQSNIFIDEKEKSISNTVQEKKQLENLIVFLSEKIRELKDERKPLEDRKKELEQLIEETYRELQEDFQFRKYLEIKEESLQKQMQAVNKEIQMKDELKESIEQKNYVFKRELSYLAEAKSLKGWTHKMQGMLKCMTEVYNGITAEEVKKISMAFIHIAEIMESNSRPYRASESNEDQFTKQTRLNEMELAYYRNKNSEKMREMQFRFKALFSQMEKQIKKLRNDNIKLIEEFNTLINEKKKLNNLRKMIKESIKEFLGDKYDEEKYNSSDEDAYKVGGKKKYKQRKEQAIQQQQNSIEPSVMSQQMTRSKSTSQFMDKHVKVLSSNLTARESNQFLSQLPDLKQSTISQVSLGGSQTQRDKSEPGKGVLQGFSMNKTQQLMSKRRMINSLTLTQNQAYIQPNVDNSKYLQRIVQEFEKNKKQIEEQTKNLKQIQNLADVFVQEQQQQQQQNSSQQQSSIIQGGAVPSLNLSKLRKQKDNVSSYKQTVTTRIPNTTERSNNKISVLDQTQQSSSLAYTNTKRNLPIVKELVSYNSSNNDNTENNI